MRKFHSLRYVISFLHLLQMYEARQIIIIGLCVYVEVATAVLGNRVIFLKRRSSCRWLQLWITTNYCCHTHKFQVLHNMVGALFLWFSLCCLHWAPPQNTLTSPWKRPLDTQWCYSNYVTWCQQAWGIMWINQASIKRREFPVANRPLVPVEPPLEQNWEKYLS